MQWLVVILLLLAAGAWIVTREIRRADMLCPACRKKFIAPGERRCPDPECGYILTKEERKPVV